MKYLLLLLLYSSTLLSSTYINKHGIETQINFIPRSDVHSEALALSNDPTDIPWGSLHPSPQILDASPRLDYDPVSIYDADLSFADLTEGNLSNYDFYHSNFMGANLSGVDFTDTYFYKVDLRYADLSNAIFNYAQIENSDLSYANLSNADLSTWDIYTEDRVHHSSSASILGANFYGTQLPKDLGDYKFSDKSYYSDLGAVFIDPFAIPEPSSYTRILGLLSLGFIVLNVFTRVKEHEGKAIA